MKRILPLSLLLVGCGTCPNIDETLPILPPANDAAAPFDLPKTGDLPLADCRKWCDSGDVISCSFDTPGQLPTMHCVLPASCE
jgi:hypothetical protein